MKSGNPLFGKCRTCDGAGTARVYFRRRGTSSFHFYGFFCEQCYALGIDTKVITRELRQFRRRWPNSGYGSETKITITSEKAVEYLAMI